MGNTCPVWRRQSPLGQGHGECKLNGAMSSDFLETKLEA